MALSAATEEAFNNAIEAAYTMGEAASVFGPHSDELEFANKIYCYWMGQYYVSKQNDDREAWWDDYCLLDPLHLGCKLYDV
jgi:hypothetical protein